MALPANEALQELIARIWKELLGIAELDVRSNLFDAGAHSLLVPRFLSEAKALGIDTLSVADVYDRPTITGLAERARRSKTAAAPPKSQRDVTPKTGFAIVGMAINGPGAPDLECFWQQLIDGHEGIRRFRPEEIDPEVPAAVRHHPNFVAARGVVDDVDRFDASFFGISAREATLIDPQQRMLLELSWNALEHAGIAPERASRVGVYAGTANNQYTPLMRKHAPQLIEQSGEFTTMLAGEKDFIATRIAHRLDLHGPAVSVLTACSTGLVVVTQACEALSAGTCDLALAAASTVLLPQAGGYLHVEGGMESSDGVCRPFDAAASGTVFSNGGAAVVLKRLEDAVADGDTIYAVVRGVGINNDGGSKASFTAPSVSGQSAAIRMALDAAEVSARDIGYVEAHGTATSLGDPIEISGLCEAYREDTDENGYCWLGSVKGNAGHTWAAAGLFGLIKACLTLHHGVIPRTLHFHRANPQIDFTTTPFRICSSNVLWPRSDRPRHAAVSSFGVGGTNAHVVLGEAPARVGRADFVADDTEWLVLPLSARSETSLIQRADALAEHLEAHPELSLSAVAYTLIRGRSALPVRQAIAVRSRSEALEKLRKLARGERAIDSPRLVYLFPGQGAQSLDMARELHGAIPEFARALDAALEAVAPWLDIDLRQLLLTLSAETPASLIDETRYAQPALFCVSVALARWLEHLGLEPDALIGHSVGELAAAHIAGVFDLDAAARVVCARASAMWAQPRGAMLAVRLPERQVLARLPRGVEIAGFNAPALTVVAGSYQAVTAFGAALQSDGIDSTALRVSHGFHSAAMENALPAIIDAVASVKRQAPSRRLYSCVSGAPLTAPEAIDAIYWARQVRQPVQFSLAVQAELERDNTIFVEVGPGQALSALVRQHRDNGGRAPRVVALQLQAGKSGNAETALNGLAQLWALGAPVAWPQPHGRPRATLPGYPFANTRFWFPLQSALTSTPPAPPALAVSVKATEALIPYRLMMEPAVVDRLPALRNELTRVVAEVCGQLPSEIRVDAPLVELGLDSLSATQASLEIERVFGQKLRFRRLMEDLDTIEKLAQHFDAELPRTAFASPQVAPQLVPPSGLPTAPQVAMASGGTSDAVNTLIQQQLALMQQQLALLSGLGATPVMSSTSAAPRPAVAATHVEPVDAAPDLIAKPFGASARITLAPQSDMTPAQREWLRDFTTQYTSRYGESRAFSQEHRGLMADPRVVTGFNPLWKDLVFPIVANRSDGARVWDIQGNEFIDLLSCFGANLLGYKPKAITQAMHEQLDKGIEVGPQHPLSAEVSQLIREFSGHQRVAFCNTGSEAVMGAMRLARTVTGRKTIAIFTNSYHGIFDEVIVRGTRQLRSIAAAPGILAAAVENILVLDYASEDSLRVLRERGDELAAIMIEPVQNKYPTLQPRQFIHDLRKICDESGCALIIDEVVTGFRLAPGGAQQFYGVRADLCAYGKIIGGGLPMAAITGASKWMDGLDGGGWQYGDDSYPEAGVTYFAGTYVRHPLALAAAKATLEYLKAGGQAFYDEMNARTEGLIDRLNAGFIARKAPVKAVHCASLWRLQWDEDQRYVSLFYYLARFHGLHLYEQFGHFVTEPMGAKELDRIAEVFLGAVDELMAFGFMTPRGGVLPPEGGVPSDSAKATDGPLSPGQSERWLAASFDDHALQALNETLTLRLDGPINLPAFKSAIADLQKRHAAFRLVFNADTPRQTEVAGSEHPLGWQDLSQTDDPEAALTAFSRSAGERKFALGKGPMIEMTLLRVSLQRHVLYLVYSHLAADGWAISVFLEELSKAYKARSAGSSPMLQPPGSPTAFAEAEQARMLGPDGQAAAHFWREILASPPAPLSLGDRSPTGARRFVSDTAYLRVEGSRFLALQSLARSRKLTLFQLLLGVVSTWLCRLARQSEFILSIPYASQGLARNSALMSDGVLDLPLRLKIDPRKSAADNAMTARAVLMDALEHPLMTQGVAARLLGRASKGDRPPLTGVYFNLNPKVVLEGFAPLEAHMQEGRKPGLLGELMLNFYEEGDALSLDLHHSTEFFSPERIAELLRELHADLSAADAPPARSPSSSPTVGESLDPMSVPSRVERWFADQVQRTPTAIAITSADGRCTFAELDARANRIANVLVVRGVSPGDWVGLCLPRSIDLLAALLGVLKCGAAYVPLDPAFPLQRLRDMAEDAGLRLLLADTDNAARLDLLSINTLRLDADADEIAAAATTAPSPNLPRDAPAYVIYTSGSTGKPKGVVVLQRGVVNFLRSMAHTPGLKAGERLLAVTTLSFDIAVLELLLPLCVGAEIVLAQRSDAIDGHALKQLIESKGVNLMQATPSTWHLLLEAGFKAPPGFRALCGGEALSPTLAQRLLEAGVEQLWNMYGPTETTVWSTLAHITDANVISVGRPIDATVVRILDEQNRECRIGERGEICIGGAGVAQGYHARPELTAERFIVDPFDSTPGARLYRTGDLGTWNDDGAIRHMGRLDHQVKLRGYRIELGEIEAAIEHLPEVARAAMNVENFGPMDDRLVAYVVAVPGIEVLVLSSMRRALGQRLPDYMLPQVLRPIDAMPLLPNGKIDRKALGSAVAPNNVMAGTLAEQKPTPATDAPIQRNSIAANQLAATIAAAMGRLLQRDELQPDEHFFEQGGHSLLAAELASEMQRAVGMRPSLRMIFEAPTPRLLADRLCAPTPSTPNAATLIRHIDGGAAPLSVQQLRAWFAEMTSSDASINLLPSAHRLKGLFDEAAFRRALRALVTRQPALRTVFQPAPDGAEQHVLDNFAIDCPLHDWSGRQSAVQEADLYQAVASLQAEPIDLAQGPPFRTAIFKLAADEHVFVFVVHHLVWDGWSFDLLYRDMAALYAAELSPSAELPAPLAIDYADYSRWQKVMLASGALQPQVAHWRGVLLPLPPPLALPADHPRPTTMSGGGGSVRLVLPSTTVELLHAQARRHGTTLFVLLLAAYTAMLQRLSGQNDMVVGTPVRGRDQAELLPVMGFFVNALPMRFSGEAKSLGPWIANVKRVTTEALGHPDVPIEALVRELQLPRDPSRPALFQAMFSFQDVRERPSHWGPLAHSRVGVPVTGASHDLSLWCVETRSGLETIFTYASDLFARDRITAWAEGYQSALLALATAEPSTEIRDVLAAVPREKSAVKNAIVASVTIAADHREEPSRDATDYQRLLQGIWSDLLGVSNIATDDNFFERGGHSLLALSMVSRVELACGKRLPLLRVGDSSLGALATLLQDVPAASAPAPGKLGGWLRRLVGQTSA